MAVSGHHEGHALSEKAFAMRAGCKCGALINFELADNAAAKVAHAESFLPILQTLGMLCNMCMDVS